ncbi:pentatricopeptide repeat-containing protein At1g64580-like [Durio zibethinus]|uniref:Pentatricopeptide repeat-containing protein At1g64580-like n=1 Tax=Durio zibethinus TaxID=66656 RepID=A0A6P5ZGC8_DURZI|nr:pentatricopeptide repeat-containing protein At1g64580-like [Durio zibethinus]
MLTYPCRICGKFRFLVSFSTSCALKTVDFFEEGDTHVSDYPELQRRMQSYATSENVCWQELVEMYMAMKRFGPPPNASTFNTLRSGMLNLGNLKRATFIVEEIYRSHFVPSFSSLLKTLKKAVQVGNLLDGLTVFELMLWYDYPPTEPTLNKFISMLCEAGMVSEACFVFSVLLRKGYVYGAYCYNPILWALCKSGRSYIALQLFYLMKKKGFVHNVCSYTALIYGFSREGLEDDVFLCLDFIPSDSCKPNVITYMIIVKFLFDNGKFE